jgi:hypothetical protein
MWGSADCILHALHMMHIHSGIASLDLQELHMLCKMKEFLYTNNSFQNEGIVTDKIVNMKLVFHVAFNLSWPDSHSLPPDKAPGPDGFTARFLQVMWDIIKLNFMSAFDAF